MRLFIRLLSRFLRIQFWLRYIELIRRGAPNKKYLYPYFGIRPIRLQTVAGGVRGGISLNCTKHWTQPTSSVFDSNLPGNMVPSSVRVLLESQISKLFYFRTELSSKTKLNNAIFSSLKPRHWCDGATY